MRFCSHYTWRYLRESLWTNKSDIIVERSAKIAPLLIEQVSSHYLGTVFVGTDSRDCFCSPSLSAIHPGISVNLFGVLFCQNCERPHTQNYCIWWKRCPNKLKAIYYAYYIRSLVVIITMGVLFKIKFSRISETFHR